MRRPARHAQAARFVLLAVLVAALVSSKAARAYELGPGVDRGKYNAAGVGINATLHKLAKSLAADDAVAASSCFDASFTTLTTAERVWPAMAAPGLRFARWNGPKASIEGDTAAIEWFRAWRSELASVDRWVLKLVTLQRVDRKGADAVVRFEVIGDRRAAGPTAGERVTWRGRFMARFDRRKKGMLISKLDVVDGRTSAGPAVALANAATATGVDFYGASDPRFLPPSQVLQFQTSRHSIGGVSAADYDGDGDDDVMFFGGERAKLYQNNGKGRFTDVTDAAGLGSIRHANLGLFADFDNDGDADLFVGQFYGRNQLWRNDGKGHFTDVTAESGLAQDDQVSSAAAVDVNGDGKLDLYLGRFLDTSKTVPQMIHYTRNGQPNRLYVGSGDLRLRDMSTGSGADDAGLTLGIAAVDYDRDGDQDLYLANDFGRNVLLRNRGDGTFEDVAKEAGTLAISGGMAASFGDYDGDGWPDIYVSSIRSNQRWFSQDLNIRSYVMNLLESDRRVAIQPLLLDLREHLGEGWDAVGQHELSGNYLLRNRGDGTFEDVSDASGTRLSGWYWGSGFVDVDNDGNLDVFAVNGWITGEKKHDL